MNNAMIEFRHVSKTFSRKGHPVLALQDINLSIAGAIFSGLLVTAVQEKAPCYV
jgi:D-methionine transport system ATP-binding protein